MKQAFYFFLIVLGSVSCRELVQSEFPDFAPVPTVNSILIADSTIMLHVSLAGKVDTNQLGWVDNAEVMLYMNDSFVERLNYEYEGIYSSVSMLKALQRYTCEVSVPGFQTVVCNNTIPEKTDISNIVHINRTGTDQEGLSYPAISFTFKNNPNNRSYYEAKIKLFKHGNIIFGTPIFITDPILLNEGIPIAVFSNELIQEESYTMTINYTTGGKNLYPFVLEFRSISYDYYQYVKQHYLYEKGRYPEIIGGVVTSFSLYSNVENGYGIFAGYSTVVSDTINPLLNEK